MPSKRPSAPGPKRLRLPASAHGRRLWYADPLGGWVFRDDGDPDRHFVVRVQPEVGRPHVLCVNAHYVTARGRIGPKARLAVDDAPVELFRVDAGNGYMALNRAGLSTGVIPELRDLGFVGGGRIEGAWREYLLEP